MKKTLVTEESVKELLGITDFRHLRKDQVIQFVSNIPNMDKEVAKKCIEQFPNFKEFSETTFSHFSEVIKDGSNKINSKSIDAYTKMIDACLEIAKKDDISQEERQEKNGYITLGTKMLFVIGTFALFIGGAILGQNIEIDPKLFSKKPPTS